MPAFASSPPPSRPAPRLRGVLPRRNAILSEFACWNPNSRLITPSKYSGCPLLEPSMNVQCPRCGRRHDAKPLQGVVSSVCQDCIANRETATATSSPKPSRKAKAKEVIK